MNNYIIEFIQNLWIYLRDMLVNSWLDVVIFFIEENKNNWIKQWNITLQFYGWRDT